MGTAAAPYRRHLRLLVVGLGSALLLALGFTSAIGAASDTTPPSTPVITLKQATSSSLLFTWTASTDNVGIKGYDIILSEQHIGMTAQTTAYFTKLQCNKRYWLGVTAVDTSGNRAKPAVIYGNTAPCSSGGGSTTPPPAPAPAPTPTPAPTPQPPSTSPAPGGSLAVAPNGSDNNPCTLSAPCLTFDHAYHRATSGQFIQVAGGSYPQEKITPDTTKTGAYVVFQPAGSASVNVAGVTINGSHVELRNMQTIWRIGTTANGVTLRNVSSPGAIDITGASNVSVLGGQIYSPTPVSTDSQIASLYGKVPTNILFDGVSFHDFRDIGPGNYHHIECLQVGAGINLTVQNSTFSNCETHDIFIRSWGFVNNSPSPLSNILIQNNSMPKTASGYYAMQVLDDLWTGSPPTSVSIIGNHFGQGVVVNVTHGTAVLQSNYIPSMSAYFCSSYPTTVTISNNTYGSGVPCGTGATVLSGGSSSGTTTTSTSSPPAPAPSPTSSTPSRSS